METGDTPDGGSRPETRAARPSARVRITSPRMDAAPRPPAWPLARDLDEQTALGEVYLRSLLRAQIWLGTSLLGTVLLAIGAIPVVFAMVPALGTARLLGIPLPWLLLGLAVHPVLLVAAWWYIRMAERNERDFAGLVDRH
ncbi:hypothetical protein [Frankia sp. CiP3]|uniref:hypothetical protein n=1 Tax=Frankia sp. CiP3 TaxID=2880971 RepID=UPI001EF6BFA0|nr:hypothetical protein [Frankia sp. CiP3]